MSSYYIFVKDGAKMMRPVLNREAYLALRNGGEQRAIVAAVRSGDERLKSRLVQMNYSCLPNDDGSLKGSTRMSSTVGMDIDHIPDEEMLPLREHILAKKDELGLLMLEVSARQKGYHLVFRRHPELSQEDNLKWASQLLDVKYDEGAKDITRVFFTTTEQDLIYLDDEIFVDDTKGSGTFVPFGVSEDNYSKEYRNQGMASCEAVASGDIPKFQDSCVPSVASEQSSSALDKKFPSEFKGVEYSSIIAEYWRRTGGEPSEGERNKRLHQLAANLRAICDNNEAWLLEVMPNFKLSDQEMKSIIHSACKEPTKGSRLMDQIVESLSPKLGDDRGLNDEDWTDATSDPQPPNLGGLCKHLPIGLKESLVGVPVSMHMPLLCGIMPMAAAYADQVEVEYCDGNIHRLGLMSIIRGEQASNKSVVKNAIDIWKRQLEEEDALARKREEEWKERKKGRKANEKAPDDPKVLIRMVPVTVSCSTLLKRFKNAKGHTLYSFGEELDTLRKTNGAGSWSSKYDIYRLSFDNGEWGQDYNSDQAESGVVKVAYNWTMLGTYGAMRKCFKQDNIENGLSSRILVAEMPDSSFQKMPKFGRRSAEDEARIQEAVTRLRSFSGLVDVPRLRKAIEAWVEEKRVEAAKDIDHVKDVYRKRAAVIGFRCGVIHHLLSVQKKESKATIDFALTMAEYCLSQQIKTFGEALQNQYVDASDECQRYGANHSVFDQLAPSFTMDDLRSLKRGYCGESALRNIITRWKRDGWIEKTDSKHWQKTPLCHNATLPH